MLLTLIVVSALGSSRGMTVSVLLFVAALVVGIISLVKYIRYNQKAFLYLLFVLLMCAVFAFNFALQLKNNRKFAAGFDDTVGYAKGVVTDIPGYDGTYRYVITCDDGFSFLLNTNQDMSANLYDNFEGTVHFCLSSEITVEQPVQAYGHSTDIRFYESDQKGIKGAVYYIRQKSAGFIDQHMPHHTACLLKGVLLGDESSFTPYLEQDFAITGLAHLLVISGSHLSIFVTVTLLFLPLGINRRRFAWMLIIPMVFYMMICGMGASVVRAGICSGLFVLSYTLKRDVNPINSLGAAAMGVCMFWPQGAVSIGFLLSFYSTLGAVLFYHPVCALISKTKLPKLLKILLKPAVLTSSAQLFITPILIICYGKLTPIALASNVIIGGMIGLLMGVGAIAVILSALIITYPLSRLLYFVANVIATVCLAIVDAMSDIVNAEITVAKGEILLSVSLLCIAASVFLLSKGKRQVIVVSAVVGAVALVSLVTFSFLATQRATVTYVTDGCTVIRYKEYTVTVGDCSSPKEKFFLTGAVYASGDQRVDVLDVHCADSMSAVASAKNQKPKRVILPPNTRVSDVPFVSSDDVTTLYVSDDFTVTAGENYTCADMGGVRVVVANKGADLTNIKDIDCVISEYWCKADSKSWAICENTNGLANNGGRVYNIMKDNSEFSVDRFYGIVQ